MSGKKLIVDLSPQDGEILRRLKEHLEVPIAQIVRWAIRYYAVNGPELADWNRGRQGILEGIEELIVGLGVREDLSCQDKRRRKKTPPPF